MGETEKELQKLWIVARLRTREGWYETRKSFVIEEDSARIAMKGGEGGEMAECGHAMSS